MLSNIPQPVRANEMFFERSAKQLPRYFTSGWNRVNQLLGGQGWLSGEVSEICGVSGVGKTMMCLNSAISLLVQDASSQAIWIETIDNEFSAQRASDTAKAHLLSRKTPQGPQESEAEQADIEAKVKSVLSRIQVYNCRDVYDILNAIEMFRTERRRVDHSDPPRPSTKLFVIDSLSAVLTNLLRMGDGVGHATMMHLSRELRQIASDYDLVVLVTTLPVQLSYPEEQVPSILMTSNVKPGLGSSWRHATDVQIFLSRMELSGGGGGGGGGSGNNPTAVPNGGNNISTSAARSADETVRVNTETRVVEVMKSKRLTTGEWCLFQLKP
ncbi:hypothetical protein BGX29_011440 [Mortierella sp. GBA35]|nr:hypothetical protein BGX29_011440 [Mortierella sp. GBA35]